jgi:hypothetical protein
VLADLGVRNDWHLSRLIPAVLQTAGRQFESDRRLPDLISSDAAKAHFKTFQLASRLASDRVAGIGSGTGHPEPGRWSPVGSCHDDLDGRLWQTPVR